MSQSSDTNEGQSCERKPCEIAVNGLKVDLFRYLQRSRNQFASLGTDLASNEYYEDAIRFLTIAIHYNRYDHRLYFNRAFCLLEMDRNQDALKDINTCIALKNGWSKAYFKKGQILANMGEFIPAHKAYKIAWKLDSDCEETVLQMRGNVYDALRQMGFDAIRAGYGAQYYFDIEEAAEALNGGALEITLKSWRFEKKQKYFNKKNQRLTPITFYK